MVSFSFILIILLQFILPPIITSIVSARESQISSVLYSIQLQGWKNFPKGSGLWHNIFVFTTFTLKVHGLEEVLSDYQTLAELICQFLGRLDEFIFYSIISNLITTGFGKRPHFFYSTSIYNCLHGIL